IPNWGWNKDKRYWLGSFTANIEDTGLPEKSLLHNGVQVFFLSLSRLLSPTPLPVAKVYKAILALFYFCLFYSFAFIGKHFFGLKNKSAALLSISVPFFATINYPFFTMGRSSYLGFFPAGGSFFHSITQFMSLPVGVAGIILALPDGKKNSLPAWGALLVSAAFFFKPSFFAITALPLAAVIWLNRSEKIKRKIISSLILLTPPLFWKLYPAIYGIEKLEVPLAFQPFQVLFHYSFRHFAPSIYANDYIFGGLIVILSFGVFIPIGLDFIIGMLEGRNSKRWEFFSELREKPAYLFSTGAFLIGILSYGLLVQDSPQKFHANLSWGAAIGYLLFLPVLIKMITAMKYLGWKIAAGILFALHLWGGIYHLYRFTFLGMIY
ncbi:MAG: hypothetical protein U9N73_04625, partial [Candidatus Auribacterota bacterium]|nr:hypothetical protein [Candidatus Auribacterota bacterium]